MSLLASPLTRARSLSVCQVMNSKHKRKKCRIRKSTPRPQPVKPGMRTLKGGDVTEAFMLAADPAARSKDRLLLIAKRMAGYAKSLHLPDSELRGVSWF